MDTSRTNNHRIVPPSRAGVGPVTLKDFEKRINEIAEVTQLATSFSGSDHASAPGARTRGLKIEGEKSYRTPEAMW